MGRRSFSGTARHCTADDDKGGAGFFRCRRRLACSCIPAGSVVGCIGVSVARPPTKRADHTACTFASRHSARRAVAWRPCPSQARAACHHPAATCAAQRTLGSSASSQQAPASRTGARGAVADPVQQTVQHHGAISGARATVSNGSAETVTESSLPVRGQHRPKCRHRRRVAARSGFGSDLSADRYAGLTSCARGRPNHSSAKPLAGKPA